MEGYLHVRAGRLGMLLPVAGVLEVLEVERAGVTAGHALWRESSLPVLFAHALLGEDMAMQGASVNAANDLRLMAETSPSHCSAVIYASAPETAPCMILVDSVAGLMPGSDLVTLCRAPADTLRLFAATVGGSNGERLYCLRRPLTSLEIPVWHGDEAKHVDNIGAAEDAAPVRSRKTGARARKKKLARSALH